MNEIRDIKVSIVMASYNHENYVADAIQSVIDQTYKNWELIIIDDGSTDSTREVIKSFLSDERIRFFEQENHGVSYTTNRCIEKAVGEVICFLDSDDLYLPEKLEKQIEMYYKGYDMISTKIDVINKDGETVDNNHRAKKYNNFDENLLLEKKESEILNRSYFIKASVMMSKSLIDNVGLFDERLIGAYDWHMWLRVMPIANIIRLDYHGTQYRWHGENEMITNNNRVNIEILLICEWYWRDALKNGKPISFDEYFDSIKGYFTKEYFAVIRFITDIYLKKNIDMSDVFVLLDDENFLSDVNKYVGEKRDIECKKLKNKIKFMESSIFWKMRNKYMHIKKIVSE